MNFTLSVVLCPGFSFFVVLPAILKLWVILPLFTTVKITVPTGTLRFESVNENSFATTVTRDVAFDAWG